MLSRTLLLRRRVRRWSSLSRPGFVLRWSSLSRPLIHRWRAGIRCPQGIQASSECRGSGPMIEHMFDDRQDLDGMDADATLAYAAAADAALNAAEVAKLRTPPRTGPTCTRWSCHRPSRAAGPCRVVNGCSGSAVPARRRWRSSPPPSSVPCSASPPTPPTRLVAAALDLRHRLPGLWARVQAGQVKAWIGRKVADATRHLTVPTCGQVDLEITPYADRISWTRLDHDHPSHLDADRPGRRRTGRPDGPGVPRRLDSVPAPSRAPRRCSSAPTPRT